MKHTDRLSLILQHPLYRACLAELTLQEKNRLYCRHDLAHFLDTARLAYIAVLENNLSYEREIIYAAALLHDIGRSRNNERHDECSAELAAKILPECGFGEAEITLITEAILQHRTRANDGALADILYTADKQSRNCFACPAKESCKWPLEKRNQTIRR